MADRIAGRTGRTRTAADKSEAPEETIRLLSQRRSNDDSDDGSDDNDNDTDFDSNLDSADGNADGHSYLDDSGSEGRSSEEDISNENNNNNGNEGHRQPPQRRSSGIGPGTTRAQQNEHLWRRRRRTASLLGTITGVILVLAAIAAGIDYRHKRNMAPGDGDDNEITPLVDLGYATYAGVHLPAVYPPSDNGGSDHNTSAAPVAINKFLGMRYAAPPLGERRWQAPTPPDSEADVQPATAFQPNCLGLGVIPRRGGGQAEDCLFVNVFAPAAKMDALGRNESEAGLPVWVFIQGGGYNANSNPDVDGADVIARSGGNIVVVDFSYRVGLYGFLAVPGNGSDSSSSANVGLLDQRALLGWVQQHIHRFGGDPRHVVIHGGSAGAGSVALHTIAYGGRDDGLFVGAVAESVFVPTLPRCEDAVYKFWRAVHAVCPAIEGEDVSDVPEALTCLRRMSVELLQHRANVAATLLFHGHGDSNNNGNSSRSAPTEGPDTAGFYWGPCVDGDLITDRPTTLFREGRFVRVPMMYGVASDEGTLLVARAETKDDVVRFIASNYPGLSAGGGGDNDNIDNRTAQAVVDEYYPQLPAIPADGPPWFQTLAQVYGELTFVCPAVNFLEAVASVTKTLPAEKRPALYAYRYNMKDPELVESGLGTVHMMDLDAIFGPRNVACCPPGSYLRREDGDGDNNETPNNTDNPRLVPVMMDYYISFVRTLDPNTFKSEHAAAWIPWGRLEERTDADRRQRLVVYDGGHQAMETVAAEQAERCHVWLGLADLVEQ